MKICVPPEYKLLDRIVERNFTKSYCVIRDGKFRLNVSKYFIKRLCGTRANIVSIINFLWRPVLFPIPIIHTSSDWFIYYDLVAHSRRNLINIFTFRFYARGALYSFTSKYLCIPLFYWLLTRQNIYKIVFSLINNRQD